MHSVWQCAGKPEKTSTSTFTWIHFDICFAILINQVKWLPLNLAYAWCCFCSYSLHYYYYYSTFENSSNSPPSEKKRKSCLSNVLRDHPYITSAKGLGWWVKKNGSFCWFSLLYLCWHSRPVNLHPLFLKIGHPAFWKNRVQKTKVIVIQKEKRQPGLFFFWIKNDPVFFSLLFAKSRVPHFSKSWVPDF